MSDERDRPCWVTLGLVFCLWALGNASCTEPPVVPSAPTLEPTPTPTPEPQLADAPTLPQPPTGSLNAAQHVVDDHEPPVVVPKGYPGTGILARRLALPNRGAPKWARVAADVTDKNGVRYLRTTAYAQGITNTALARSTAENRARATLARWLKVEKLEQSEIVKFHYDKRKHIAYAMAQIKIPAGSFSTDKDP